MKSLIFSALLLFMPIHSFAGDVTDGMYIKRMHVRAFMIAEPIISESIGLLLYQLR